MLNKLYLLLGGAIIGAALAYYFMPAQKKVVKYQETADIARTITRDIKKNGDIKETIIESEKRHIAAQVTETKAQKKKWLLGALASPTEPDRWKVLGGYWLLPSVAVIGEYDRYTSSASIGLLATF